MKVFKDLNTNNMRKLQNHSLFPVWSQTIVSGIIAFIILMVLFSDVIEETGIFIWIGFLIHIFLPIILCIVVYLPLREYDEEKLIAYSFNSLINRYLPFYTLPFVIPITFLFFIPGSFRYEGLLVLLTLYFISIFSLISFIRSIKESEKKLKLSENQLQTE